MDSVCNIFMEWVLMLTMDLWVVIEVIIIYHPYMSVDSSKCNINTKAMRALHLIIITFFGEKLSSHELYDVQQPHTVGLLTLILFIFLNILLNLYSTLPSTPGPGVAGVSKEASLTPWGCVDSGMNIIW